MMSVYRLLSHKVGSAQYVTNPHAVQVTICILQPAGCLTSNLLWSVIVGDIAVTKRQVGDN